MLSYVNDPENSDLAFHDHSDKGEASWNEQMLKSERGLIYTLRIASTWTSVG
jgi:hypothetical protein